MTAGSARLKETGTSSLYFDENKELNQNIQTEDEVILSAPADANKMEFLTNDQGDIFYQPQKGISNKLTNSFIEEKELSDKINNWNINFSYCCRRQLVELYYYSVYVRINKVNVGIFHAKTV